MHVKVYMLTMCQKANMSQCCGDLACEAPRCAPWGGDVLTPTCLPAAVGMTSTNVYRVLPMPAFFPYAQNRPEH